MTHNVMGGVAGTSTHPWTQFGLKDTAGLISILDYRKEKKAVFEEKLKLRFKQEPPIQQRN